MKFQTAVPIKKYIMYTWYFLMFKVTLRKRKYYIGNNKTPKIEKNQQDGKLRFAKI